MPLLVDVLEQKNKGETTWSSSFLDDIYEREIGSKLPTSKKDEKEEPSNTPVTPTEPLESDTSDDSLLDSDMDSLGVEDSDEDVAVESYLAMEYEDGYAMSGSQMAGSILSPIASAGKLAYSGAKSAAGLAAAGAVGAYAHYKGNKEAYHNAASKVGEGVKFTGKKLLSAFFKGSSVISRFTDRKINNLSKLKQKLINAREVLALIESTANGVYTKDVKGILHAQSLDVLATTQRLDTFLKNVSDYSTHEYKGKLLSLSKGISRIRSEHVSHDISHVDESLKVKGFKKSEEDSNTVTYESVVLPGGLLFRIKTPIDNPESLLQAYKSSTLELIADDKSRNNYTETKYLEKSKLLLTINSLLEIAEILEESKHSFSEIATLRNRFESTVKREISAISDKVQDKYIEDSYLLAKERSLYLDRVHTALILKTEELAFQFLKAGIQFVESNIAAFKKAT